MKRFFLYGCFFGLFLPVMGAEVNEPTEMTASIKNPSFEEGLNGWEAIGFQKQTNNSPSDEGWNKDGTVYAEKWVSSSWTLPDVKLSQTVTGLPQGSYTVKVYAHAVNQSGNPEITKGVSFFAGLNEVQVGAGGEYRINVIVTDGRLDLGMKVSSTDANWVACDNFRLYYHGREEVDAYRKDLTEKLALASAAMSEKDCHNRSQLEQAVHNAESVEGDIESLLTAILDLEQAITEYRRLTVEYGAFERAFLNARKLYSETDFPGKTVFGEAIDQVSPMLDVPEGKDLMGAVTRLEKATQVYLDSRPSNWMTLRNGALWKDDRGEVVQAHGAGFLQVGDTWYMIGEDRNNTWNPDVNMYSTKDFVNWKFERKIIRNGSTHPSLGNGRFIERPKLMYCRKTGKYVVWCHWEQGNYGASEAAVFYCDSVNGDYKFHWAGRPLGVKSRDCNVFVDDDGTAYFISTIEENQHLGLFRLSDDYLSAVEYTELFKWQSREAPAIVREGDTYFMMFSACSGWDPNQASFSWSKSLTSGWSSRTNIGNSVAYDTQAASILTIKGSEGTSYVYVGDRWQDPGLAESKTILFPISFKNNTITFNYVPRFDMNLPTGQCRTTGMTHLVSKEGWKVRACSSEETSSENGASSNAIDGRPDTKWHTRYSGGGSEAPHFLEIDMGNEQEIAGFLCTPRNDNSSNGLIRKYLFLVSSDGIEWKAVSGGTWLPYWTEVYFEPIVARYFRLVATEGTYASLAELDVLSSAPSYTPVKVTGSWQYGTMVSSSKNPNLRENSTVKFMARTEETKGTWAFYGPKGQMLHTNEYNISSLKAEDAGWYSFIFTDYYNQSAKVDFKLRVRTSSVGVKEVPSEAEGIVRRQYFTLSGTEVPIPVHRGMFVVRTLYEDGRVDVAKVFIGDSDC